jgi:aspartate-semialdehyde dehydrogenase
MRSILDQRGFPLDDVRFFASSRSEGRLLTFQGRDVVVVESATPAGGI